MADLYGRLFFEGTLGATVGAEIDATLLDGSGTGTYVTGGYGDVGVAAGTIGQFRINKDLVVPPDEEGGPGGPLPTEAHVWGMVSRASGRVGNNANGTPSTVTNILSFLTSANEIQIALAITSSAKASLVKADGTAGSGAVNVQSKKNIYCDGHWYKFLLEIDQASVNAYASVYAGLGHPDYAEDTLLDEMAMSTGVGLLHIDKVRIGSMATGATAHVQRLDEALISDTPLVVLDPGSPPGGATLQRVTLAPLVGGFAAHVKINAGDAYRVRAYLAGNEVAGSPTTAVTPIASGGDAGYARLEFTAGLPLTQYEVRFETRISGIWTSAGQPQTVYSLPEPGVPCPEIRLVICCCSQSNTHDYWAYDDAAGWVHHWCIHLGDIDYANNANPTLAAQLGHLEQQLDLVRPLREMFRSPGVVGVCRSDHDGEGHDDVYGQQAIPGGGGATYGDVCVQSAVAFERIFACIPPVGSVDPLTGDSTRIAGTLAYRIPMGRVSFIYADMRGEWRVDPYGPDADTYGAAFGVTQLDALCAWIRDPAYEVKILFFDPPYHGTPDDKGDAVRNYAADQAAIAAACADAQGVVICGDLHGIGMDSGVHVPGGWPLIHVGAIRSGKGESNSQHNGGYENFDHGYIPAENQATSDPTKPVASYVQFILRDSVTAISFEATGRDLAPGYPSSPLFMSHTWGSGAYEPRIPYVQLAIEGTDLEDTDNGRHQLEIPTAIDGLEFQPVLNTVEGLHGAPDPARGYFSPGTLAVPVIVYADSWDVTAARIQLRDRLADLRRLVQGNSTIVATYPDGSKRRAEAMFRSMTRVRDTGADASGRYGSGGVQMLVLFSLRTFWRDLDPVTSFFGSSDDPLTDGQILRLTEFEASTAPLCDLTTELRGQLEGVELWPQDRGKDMQPDHAMKYLAADGGELSGPTRILVIAQPLGGQVSMTAYNSGMTPPTWDPEPRALSSPGSPYNLELPAGGAGEVPKIKLKFTAADEHAHIEVSGYNQYVSL